MNSVYTIYLNDTEGSGKSALVRQQIWIRIVGMILNHFTHFKTNVLSQFKKSQYKYPLYYLVSYHYEVHFDTIRLKRWKPNTFLTRSVYTHARPDLHIENNTESTRSTHHWNDTTIQMLKLLTFYFCI